MFHIVFTCISDVSALHILVLHILEVSPILFLFIFYNSLFIFLKLNFIIAGSHAISYEANQNKEYAFEVRYVLFLWLIFNTLVFSLDQFLSVQQPTLF